MGAQVLESDGGAHPIPLRVIQRDLGLTIQHLLPQKNGSELRRCLPEPGAVVFGPEMGFPGVDWGPSRESVWPGFRPYAWTLCRGALPT